MRVLGIDYGSVRIGCALSDRSGTLATPLPAVGSDDPGAIVDLVASEGVERVVIGLPVSLDGSEGGQAAETRRFGDRLAGMIAIPVEYYDERFTTRMASRTRRELGASSDEDSIAAAHMLETWLESTATGGGSR